MRQIATSVSVILCLMLIASPLFADDKEMELFQMGLIESPNEIGPVQIQSELDDITWTQLPSCPVNFCRSASGIIGDYLYIFGGLGSSNIARAFNLVTQTWEIPTPPPVNGSNWCGVVANDMLYVFPKLQSADVQRFTPTGGGPTGTWELVAFYPVQNFAMAAAWDGGNYIYCAGGSQSGYGQTAYRFNLTNHTFTPIASLPQPRSYTGGAFVNGKFYVVGGFNPSYEFTNTLFEYDPNTDVWTEKSPLPVAVGFSVWATTANNSYVFCVGGGGAYYIWPAVEATQVYNPVTDTWTLDTPRMLANGVNLVRYAFNGNYLLDMGGYAGTTYYNVVWKGSNPPGSQNPNAPAMPSNFTVTHNNADLIATLNWTNPSLAINGGTLTELSGVIIYRGSTFLDSLTTVQIGQPTTYNDNTVPSPGTYNYKIIPYNSYGPGIEAYASAWIGLDVPGPAGNVIATPDPGQALEATVTWTAPTQGYHGAYWPVGSWTGQKVYRDGVMIADLPGTNTSYVDNTVPINGWYTYGVSYYNTSGEGPVVNADPIPVGPPQFEAVPYSWVEISGIGTNTGITGDDQIAGPFNIGFNFPFYDQSYHSTLWVCSNGFLAFDSTALGYTNTGIPNSAEPNNLIAAYWDDLNPSAGGAIYYYYDVANNRFIVEYFMIPIYGMTGSSLTFEVILYPSGDIDIMYSTMTATALNSCTVGIENSAGTTGIQVTYNWSGPLNPAQNTGIRIYSVFPQAPDVEITMTPINPPIQIPATGGSFNFDVNITNNTTNLQNVDAWIMVTLPNGNPYGPVLGPVNLNLPGGASITRTRTQNVPGNAPAGTYHYIGNVGTYPGVIEDDDSFTFVKLTAGDGVPVSGWENWGESWDELAVETPDAVPVEFALHGAYPNPFNPTTSLSFSLPEAGRVTLTVFDVQGKVVARLADGRRSAGTYQVTFDASNLASGIYFARLEAGAQIATQKLLLLK